MQDRAVVAAIVAGDPDGIGEAYNRYAPLLYAYCRSMLAEAEAAEAMLGTFVIAVARLDGLGDPDRLEAWLHAVARNECLRLLGPGRAGSAAGAVIRGAVDLDDELPAVTLPVELRSKVLTACTDNSPAGRAQRMSLAHRAGPFGPTGFPKAAGAAGPPWWQRVRRHPGVAAAVAVLAAAALSAGITMTAGGSHRPQAAALGLGQATAGPAPGRSSAAPSTVRKTSPSPSPSSSSSSSRPGPSATGPGGAISPDRTTPAPAVLPSLAPSVLLSAPPPAPSPSSSPSLSLSPSQGYLVLAPDKLELMSVKGKPASGSFVLTASNGPVSQYLIRVPVAMAGKVTVSPPIGSLSAGGHVEVTVTVRSVIALSTHLTVEPGNLTVQVTYKLKT